VERLQQGLSALNAATRSYGRNFAAMNWSSDGAARYIREHRL
jgi:hypothetical protein